MRHYENESSFSDAYVRHLTNISWYLYLFIFSVGAQLIHISIHEANSAFRCTLCLFFEKSY